MTRKLNSNIDLLTDLCTYSPYGALAQAMIIACVREYVKQLADADPAKFDNALISGDGWVGCARDIKRRMDAFYEEDNT